MQEKTLLKIALISSLLGILLILFIAEKIDISNSNISEIKTQTGKVKIKGIISTIKETASAYLMTVKDNTDSITVLVFKDSQLNLTRGMVVEIEGTLIKYNNQTEISADIIRI